MILKLKGLGVLLTFLLIMGCQTSKAGKPEIDDQGELTKLDDLFISAYKVYPSKLIKKTSDPYKIPINKTILPNKEEVDEWLEESQATALIVIKDGAVLYEEYFRKHSETKQHISFSMAKSFTSLLVGIAIGNKDISSVDDKVEKYAPELVGTAYEGATIKEVLQMSSGVLFNEDYGDPKSDISRMSKAGRKGSLSEFITTLKREKTPGTYNHYKSCDSLVLGMVLIGATGKTITELTQKNIWDKLGMEGDAYWLVDKEGLEFTHGGLNALSRDYAKFGLLYLNKGKNFKGEQVVSSQWVKDSYTPDTPCIMPNADKSLSDSDSWGYGYQFWVVPEEGTDKIVDYLAIGIHGQFIYINRAQNVVIVKNSAYADYDNSGDEMEEEAVWQLRRIADQL